MGGGVRFNNKEDVFLSLDDNELHYHIPSNFGDFLYSNGKVGTGITDDIVGLCVVPSTHTDDGMGRFMCLTDTDENGGILTGETRTGMTWGLTDSEVLIDKVDGYPPPHKIPICESGDSCTLKGTAYNAYLPSDIFTTGTVVTGNCIPKDLELRMEGTGSDFDTQRCPYPYLADYSKNPAYFSDNASKFLDGWRLTRVLSDLGADYQAARACAAYGSKNYGGNASSFETYLPTIGELCYVMARLGKVNEILTSLGANGIESQTVATRNRYWSSSEFSNTSARYLYTINGDPTIFTKDNPYYVRPFIKRA